MAELVARVTSQLTDQIERLPAGGAETWLFFTLLAAAGGALELIRPGRAQAILAAYFVAQPARPMHGAAVGIVVGLAGSLAGLLVGFAAYSLPVQAVQPVQTSVGLWFRYGGAAVAMLLGAILSVRGVEGTLHELRHHKEYRLLRSLGRISEDIPGHEHDPARGIVEQERQKLMGSDEERPQLLPLLALGSIRPSAAAALVVFAASAAELPIAGILGAAAAGIGGALAFGLSGLLFILVRERVFELAAVRFGRALTTVTAMIGSIALFALGVIVVLQELIR